MFDRLLDFILETWERVIPIVVVDEYQKAVILRMGKFKEVLEPGWHWKIPFADNPILQHTIVTTMGTSAQSLVTQDRREVTVESIVKYNIEDIKKYCLEIFDATDAIQDITQAVIKQNIMQKTLEDCYNPELDNIITKKVRSEVRKYGINIHQVTLTTLGQIKSFRLIGENPNLQA